MHQYTFRKIFTATGALALFSVIVFWSFNELSELFGGPQAQFKHAIAAIGFLLVIKWTVTRFRGGQERSSIKHRHLRSSRDNVCDH
jgi:hypothetical protein